MLVCMSSKTELYGDMSNVNCNCHRKYRRGNSPTPRSVSPRDDQMCLQSTPKRSKEGTARNPRIGTILSSLVFSVVVVITHERQK